MTPITPKPDLDAIQKNCDAQFYGSELYWHRGARTDLPTLVAYTRTLQERVKELERALGKYADAENWGCPCNGSGDDDPMHNHHQDEWADLSEGPEIARAALSEVSE